MLGFALIGAIVVLFLGNVVPILIAKIRECRRRKRKRAPEKYVHSERPFAQSVPTISPA